MKNLILVLFAIVTFGFGINAQDLSFKSFDKSLKPKGELIVVEKRDDIENYYYQEWDKYSITQSYFRYNVGDKQVGSVSTKTVFYDELDFENVSVKPESDGKYFTVEIKTKMNKSLVLSIAYESEYYDKYTFADIKFVAKSQKDADALIQKLKDKAFDMSLDLDASIDRINPLEDSLKFSEEFPDGADYDQREAAKNGGSSNAKSNSKNTEDDSTEKKTVSFVTVTLKHTGAERYYLSIIGDENAECTNQVFSFTHSKYGEESRRYTFCEGQKLIEKNTGRVIFIATKAMDGTTFKIN